MRLLLFALGCGGFWLAAHCYLRHLRHPYQPEVTRLLALRALLQQTQWTRYGTRGVDGDTPTAYGVKFNAGGVASLRARTGLNGELGSEPSESLSPSPEAIRIARTYQRLERQRAGLDPDSGRPIRLRVTH